MEAPEKSMEQYYNEKIKELLKIKEGIERRIEELSKAEQKDKGSDQDYSVCDGLEEEIENYLKDSLAVKFPTTNVESIKADVRYIARHFANWQKKQATSKACEWLKNNINCSLWIMDFKKYIKD